MEYVQMTLDDWVQMKQKLKQELLGVKQSFVRIGYALRKIEDQRLYGQDGYKSVAEFAKAEYGLEPSTTSRFMSINREYSVDGYSETLRPEYADLGRSQLEEMLKLPDSDRQMIRPETPREDIRALKRFNKEGVVPGAADDIRELVGNFYTDNPETVDKVMCLTGITEQNTKGFAEAVNPGGNRSYRKGIFFMMMYENQIMVKKYGSSPEKMSWWEFYRLTEAVLEDVAAERDEKNGQTEYVEMESEDGSRGKKTSVPVAENESGRIQTVQADGEPDTGCRADGGNGAEKTAEEPEDEIAPAQKSPEILKGKTSDESENREDYGTAEPEAGDGAAEPETEVAAEETEPGPEVMNAPDTVKPFGSRKDYMETLTACDMAVYMAGEYKRHNLKASSLAFPSELESWLLKEVDANGRETE